MHCLKEINAELLKQLKGQENSTIALKMTTDMLRWYSKGLAVDQNKFDVQACTVSRRLMQGCCQSGRSIEYIIALQVMSNILQW